MAVRNYILTGSNFEPPPLYNRHYVCKFWRICTYTTFINSLKMQVYILTYYLLLHRICSIHAMIQLSNCRKPRRLLIKDVSGKAGSKAAFSIFLPKSLTQHGLNGIAFNYTNGEILLITRIPYDWAKIIQCWEIHKAGRNA